MLDRLIWASVLSNVLLRTSVGHRGVANFLQWTQAQTHHKLCEVEEIEPVKTPVSSARSMYDAYIRQIGLAMLVACTISRRPLVSAFRSQNVVRLRQYPHTVQSSYIPSPVAPNLQPETIPIQVQPIPGILAPAPAQQLFQSSFELDLPIGHCHGLRLPQLDDETLPDLSSLVGWELHSDEITYASKVNNPRGRLAFLGGRIALRRALRSLAICPTAPGAVLKDGYGAPLLPVNLQASISHKPTLAVCLVRTSEIARPNIGIDVERCQPNPDVDISPRVLTETERLSLGGLTDLGISAASEVLLRFSLKESAYKAIHPYVRRYVSFKEAEVRPLKDGRAEMRLLLKHGEGPFQVEAYWQQVEEGQFFLSAVQMQRMEGPGDNQISEAEQP